MSDPMIARRGRRPDPALHEQWRQRFTRFDSSGLTLPIRAARRATSSPWRWGRTAGLSINPSTGLIAGTVGAITPSLGPWYDVTVTATDGTFSNSWEFFWSVVPSVAPAPTISAIASDAAGYVLTYNATTLPNGLSIDPNSGEISGVMAEDAVGESVVVTADDGVGDVASATFFLGVNPAAASTERFASSASLLPASFPAPSPFRSSNPRPTRAYATTRSALPPYRQQGKPSGRPTAASHWPAPASEIPRSRGESDRALPKEPPAGHRRLSQPRSWPRSQRRYGKVLFHPPWESEALCPATCP
jgi:Putative Ig domain